MKDWAATVQALAAVLSVYLTYRTIRLSVLSSHEQRQAKDVEKRERYFGKYVVDLAMEWVPQFREVAVSVLEKAIREANDYDFDQFFLDQRFPLALEEFNQHLYSLRERLSFADSAVGSFAAYDAIETALEALEDGVATDMNTIATSRKADAVDVAATVRRHTATILREIYLYDVAAHTFVPDHRGWLAKTWENSGNTWRARWPKMKAWFSARAGPGAESGQGPTTPSDVGGSVGDQDGQQDTPDASRG